MESQELDEQKLIDQCQKFLEKCSKRFSDDIDKQLDALEIAGGNFWSEEKKKRWGVYDKDNPDGSLIPVLSYNNISAQVNAIASPFSKSPFHINIVDHADTNNKELQRKITSFEGSNSAKNIYNRAFTRGVTCSAGYVVVGTNLDSSGNIIPNLEFASNQTMVAIDPDCITPDGSDAEEGALISYISIKKARRQYGDDVIPDDFPKTQPRLSFKNCKAWKDETDRVQVVRYFVKDTITNPKDGRKRPVVKMYTLCGDKVVCRNESDEISPVIMATPIIPIVRFAGYNDYDRDRGQVYTGFVQKMMPNIEMMSLALTLQATRMRRCSNVRYMGPSNAQEGCEGYFRDFEKGSSMGLLWNPKSSGVQLVNDTFQTGDISAVMSEIRSTMQDMSGINLAGIQAPDRTATEVMQQQINSESNVQELYLNAEAACTTLAKVVLAIMNKGNIPAFTLEGGPSVITSQMKERAEIQAIQAMVPPEQQMLLAIRMANTIESDIGKGLVQDLKANCGLQLTEGKDIGAMMNIVSQMKMTLDQTMQNLEQANSEKAEMEKQLQAMEQQLNDQKINHQIDLLKWQADMRFKEAQMQIDNSNVAQKLRQEDDKIRLQAVEMGIKDKESQSKVSQQMISEDFRQQKELLKLQTMQAKAEMDMQKINNQAQLESMRARNQRDKMNYDNMINFNPQGLV